MVKVDPNKELDRISKEIEDEIMRSEALKLMAHDNSRNKIHHVRDLDPLFAAIAEELIITAEALRNGLTSQSPLSAVFRAIIDLLLLGRNLLSSWERNVLEENPSESPVKEIKFIKPPTVKLHSTIETIKWHKVLGPEQLGEVIPDLVPEVVSKTHRTRRFRRERNWLNASGTEENTRIFSGPRHPLVYEPDFQGKPVTIKFNKKETIVDLPGLREWLELMAETFLQVRNNQYSPPDQFVPDRQEADHNNPKKLSGSQYFYRKRQRAHHKGHKKSSH